MKTTAKLQQRSLLVAALVSGGLGIAGIAFAADPPATTNPPPAMAPKPATDATAPKPAVVAIAPSKSETADAAFKKLDVNSKGYITMDDAKVLPAFDKAFQQSDADHDGRLNVGEFKKAWETYSGNKG